MVVKRTRIEYKPQMTSDIGRLFQLAIDANMNEVFQPYIKHSIKIQSQSNLMKNLLKKMQKKIFVEITVDLEKYFVTPKCSL